MRNTCSAKLSMIIQLSDDEDLVHVTGPLDASQHETMGTHDSKEAPNIGATRGTAFPFDLGGATDHVLHGMHSLEIQLTRGMLGQRSTSFIVEHQVAMPFHAHEDACGNAPMDKDKIHWDGIVDNMS